MKLQNFYKLLLFLMIALIGCKERKITVNSKSSKTNNVALKMNAESFKKRIDGKSTDLFSIKNANNIEVAFTNYGQRLVSLFVPDKKGVFEDVVLGFSDLDGYLNAQEKYFGATIGRYGNRIAKGKFSIGDTDYQLALNNNGNHLHGGDKGFESSVWNTRQISKNEIEFERISIDGEEGYPGNLNVKVNYSLTNSNELKIVYTATCDQITIINLTHHSFFNLAGEGNGTIKDHILTVNANKFTPIDNGLIPTGELADVAGTPFDFRLGKSIGKDIESKNEQLLFGKGYDHNFILNNNPVKDEGLTFAAKVKEPKSGRVMEVYTNEPGLQFYSGNFLDGEDIGKSGKPYIYRGAFCLETQHFPDSPNKTNFPSTVLMPGEVYTSICVYKFLVEK
ncbi:aldose 1-epimerase [Arenibacter sp. ARW7G5Y1]|nr:aldose 1-epimerase [Arenibacter sp. ARW7G5Y1]